MWMEKLFIVPGHGVIRTTQWLEIYGKIIYITCYNKNVDIKYSKHFWNSIYKQELTNHFIILNGKLGNK
jgi:acetaldehyde dehydrogenase (acetylating)